MLADWQAGGKVWQTGSPTQPYPDLVDIVCQQTCICANICYHLLVNDNSAGAPALTAAPVGCQSMPATSIVDDYLLAVMLRARGSRAENGTVVLTVPEFRGIVACGQDPREAFDELYRLLEDWVRVSFEKGYQLPVLMTEGGTIDLNRADVRALGTSPRDILTAPSEHDRTYVGGPEEFEAFLERVGSSDSVTDR